MLFVWFEFSSLKERDDKIRKICNKVPDVSKAMDGAVFDCSGKLCS